MANDSASTKHRLTLTLSADHPLQQALDRLKERGLKAKEIDCDGMVAKALSTVAESFWQDQVEAQTPLQWRVEQAMADPKMRDRLAEVLAQDSSQTSSSNSEGSGDYLKILP